MGTRIRWAFHALDHSKVGTIEEVPTEDVPWLIHCGNAVLAPEDPADSPQTAVTEAPASPAVPAADQDRVAKPSQDDASVGQRAQRP